MTDILSAVQARGIELKAHGKKHGGEFVGPCPFCREGTDRFHVWPHHEKWNGGGFWCRICRKSGDLIAFHMEMDGLSYGQACQAAGCDPKQYGYVKPAMLKKRPTDSKGFSPIKYPNPDKLWLEKALAFTDAANERLLKNPTALAKLYRDRGLTEETVRRFRLGLNDADFFRPRKSWGLPEEISEKTGKPKKLWIPRGLVVPYLVEGKVVRIRIRRPKADLKSEKDPRYYFVPGSSPAIMLIGEEQKAYVVEETELDGMLIAQEAGDLVGVLALGTAASKPDKYCASHLKKADMLLISLDSDEAGRKASPWWLENYLQAERWPVPDGKDPGDMFRTVDVRSWVLAGLPPAWHVGSRSLPKQPMGEEGNEKKAIDLPPDKAPTGLPEYPDSVMELGRMLQQYPVRIISTDKRLGIEEAPQWNNEEASRRISQLVFFDGDVISFLDAHPKPVINGSNYFEAANG